jgi:uncharacterized protein YdaU (DUF1376 family)
MSLEWFPFNIAKYLKNTLHLTARQHGAYLLLILVAVDNDGLLPASDAALASIAKLDAKAWREDGEVLKAFLTPEGAGWLHEYARFVAREAAELIAKKSRAGKAGAKKRWEGRRRGDGREALQ